MACTNKLLYCFTLSIVINLNTILHYQSKKMKLHHHSPSESFSDKTNFTLLPKSTSVPDMLQTLDNALLQKQSYEYLFVCDFSHVDRRACYNYIQTLTTKGLSKHAVLCTHTIGSSIGMLIMEDITILHHLIIMCTLIGILRDA